MHNIVHKCKNFKNECIFIFFAKSSLQNMIDSRVSMDCFCARVRFGNSYRRIGRIVYSPKRKVRFLQNERCNKISKAANSYHESLLLFFNA